MHALQARTGEFISLRRVIHRRPELAFEEHRTAALVADKLEGWGYAVERGIGGTGVVGTLVRGQSKKRLGIRTDMDALPINEASGAERASVHRGVMHACVMALQTIVSRNIDPLHAAVVTVGALHAGKANNVIPASATLGLGVRALDHEVRATLEQRIKALVVAQAESFGVTACIDWKRGWPVLVNSPAETAFAREVAVELVGAERVTQQGPPLLTSEDFAFMLERVPGSYVPMGNDGGSGTAEGGCMVHSPGYDFNDHNVAVGSAYRVLLAERFLAAKEQATVQ